MIKLMKYEKPERKEYVSPFKGTKEDGERRGRPFKTLSGIFLMMDYIKGDAGRNVGKLISLFLFILELSFRCL